MDLDLIVKDPQEIVNILNDQIHFKNNSSKFEVSVIKQFEFLSLKQNFFVSIRDIFF